MGLHPAWSGRPGSVLSSAPCQHPPSGPPLGAGSSRRVTGVARVLRLAWFTSPLPSLPSSGPIGCCLCATVPSTASEAAFWSSGVIVVHMRIWQSPKRTVHCRPLEWSRNPGLLARLRGSQHWRHRGRLSTQPGSVCDGRSGGPSTEASICPHMAFFVPLSWVQILSRACHFIYLFCPLPERHLAGRRSPEWRLSLSTRVRHLPRRGRRPPRCHSSRIASATSRSPVSCSFSTTGPGIRCGHFPCWGPGGPVTAVCRLVPTPEGAHGRLARVPLPHSRRSFDPH